MSRSAISLAFVFAVGAALCSCNGSNQVVVPGPPQKVAPPGAHGFMRVVPTDTRPVRSASIPPVPISGGTLLVTHDAKRAVAADPDRDRVSVVDLQNDALLYTIALQPGDEPGRLVEDDAGRVHVALRRAGAVASIDLTQGKLVDRRAVCGAPRGIAFDANARVLKVACASGELVTLPADGGDVSARVQIGTGLRDVITMPGGDTYVSRFKAAQLLHVPAGADAAMTWVQPEPIVEAFPEPGGSSVVDTLEPEIAWRTVAADGGLFMLHQGARNGEIELRSPQDASQQEVAALSPYGGGGLQACPGVVQSELTRFDANGEPSASVRVPGVLAVDVAVAASGTRFAIAQAGLRDLQQPIPTVVVKGDTTTTANAGLLSPAPPQLGFETGAVTVFGLPLPTVAGSCIPPQRQVRLDGQPTAVAYTSDGTLVVQTREPATIATVAAFADAPDSVVDLGGDSVYDTGHELFHRDAGAGIACASCHAEGGEDGHIWHFDTLGARRTQSLQVGLEGTAPFHWAGDMPNVSALMEEVLVSRMGGVHESPERSTALENWLYELRAPAPLMAADDPAVLRGKALFEGEAECASCHSGPKFTDNRTVDVGTGGPLQVPSLIGVAYRLPLIHTGCAQTLRERFDPSCGGAKHGHTAQLSEAQLDDLIAYLRSL